MLAIDNIEVLYGGVSLVLRGVSLRVDNGQMVALLGANGAGKSTLLKAVSGLLHDELGEVTRGAIHWHGAPITARPPEDIVRLGILQVMEGRPIFQHLTIEENLRVGAAAYRAGRSARHDMERVFTYFPRLRDMRARTAGYLSGGEQQMLVIGRALMGHPRLMLLDEPSLGLAPMLVAEIFEIVGDINQQEGMSILLVEQNARAALSLVDYGYVMESGRIVLDGSAAQLADNEDIKEFYLGLNQLGQRKSYRDVKHYRRRKRWLG